MNATVLHHRNPLCMSDQVEDYMVDGPMSIRTWLDKQNIKEFSAPTICLFNGDPVLRDQWPKIQMGDGDLVQFISLPRGGGGGSKILKTVLSVAVAAVAPYAAAAMGFTAGTLSAALATAAITAVGGAIVNAFLPAPSPSIQSSYNTPSPSPTYSLQAQGNAARIGEPIPVQYGRHMMYPDFATRPYVEYTGNDQYLYQLFCLGQGEYDVEQIRIEDTPISSFKEITYEVLNPGDPITILDPTITTSPEVAGQELLGTINGEDWVGPFIASGAETTVDEISVDIVFPRGLYYADDQGNLVNRTVSISIEAREIDDNGDPVGNYFLLEDISYTENENTPQRFTHKYPVTPARYEVRATRTSSKSNSARVGNDVVWEGLKARRVDTVNFPDVTLLAMRMRATNNLSQDSSRKVNVISTRKLPVWDGTSWSAPQPTRSIAWAIADIFRAQYGASLDDDRLSLSELLVLDQTWEARGDYFDAIFDTKLTVWEAAKRAAQCGRTVPYQQTGRIRFVRDEPRTIPTSLFSTRNIVKGSFDIEYLLPSEETADSIIVRFFNSKTWKQDEVEVSLFNETSEKAASVVLYGCTDKQHAMREGYYMAASNYYRRRIANLTTEMEGMIPSYGDLVKISHDLPRWGISGDVVDYQYPILTLAEPVTFTAGESHYIDLRRADGGVSGPWLVTEGSTPYEVILTEEPDFVPYTGSARERTHFTFANGSDEYAVMGLIRSITPMGERVKLSAVIEASEVHTAENAMNT